MNSALTNNRSNVRTVWYLAVNTVGAFVFLLIASRSWIEPELADVRGASGGQGLVWFLTVAPVLLLFLLLNASTLVWAGVSRSRQRHWPLSKLSWLSIAIWLCALLVDNAHHGA